jgi:DNA-binding MarR family transcriptional regulator
MADDREIVPPAQLRDLVQWQVSKISTLGVRLTAALMPLQGRADFAILSALSEYGPLSQAELGRRLGLDRNDVNEVVNRLEGARSVDRRTDPSDRRRNIITITTAGRGELAVLVMHAEEVQDRLLEALDDEERAHLRMLLAKVLAGHTPQPA